MIPTMIISASDLRSSLAGKTEKNIAELFQITRSMKVPIFIFLDELDALLSSRGSHGVKQFYLSFNSCCTK